MNELIEYLGKQSKPILIISAIVAVVVLGGIDHLTGPELSFSIFYLLPVSMVAWFVGRRAGILISIISALTWLIADLAAGRTYSHPAIPEWNALVRLGFFLIITYSLTSLREARYKQQELVQFVIHDLRTPLGIIILGLDAVQRTGNELNKTLQGFVKSSVISAQWMLTLVNSLLDLSRLESGKLPLQISETSVKTLIEASLEQMALWTERSQVTITTEFNTDLETIYADRELTMRVLVNLLGNAIKFSPPESVVTIRVAPAGVNMLAFSVIDQGPGIPEKWTNKVFDKFAQIEARRAGAAVGSGLGLTFCQLAIKAQGGQISLTNNPDRGTIVTFTLPVAAPQPVRAPSPSMPDASA